MRALAYNVLYSAAESTASLDAIAAAEADIVCLRELTPDFAKRFAARFAERYPSRSLDSREGTWGVGIASRWHVVAAEVFAEKPHRLPAMQARVATPSGELVVVCVHLFPPVGKHKKSDGFFETMDKNAVLRRQQASYLAARYENEAAPVLILGDMNETRHGGALEVLRRAGFQHACDAPYDNCGATYPGPALLWPAVFEIDHILGRGVTFSAAAVVKAGGSDHYPVVAAFSMP